jgi:tRNA pseudouridine55 synthase
VEDAPPPDAVPAPLTPAAAASALFPVLTLDAGQVIELRQGKRLPLPGRADTETVAAVTPDGVLVGLVSVAGGVGTVRMNLPVPDPVAR